MVKQPRVPPTPAEPVEQEQQFEAPIPIQIILNIAGIDVEKISLPNGRAVYTLNLISPTGIAVAVRLNDESAQSLARELTGTLVETFPAAALPK